MDNDKIGPVNMSIKFVKMDANQQNNLNISNEHAYWLKAEVTYLSLFNNL